jgi:CHAT domain-containing protein
MVVANPDYDAARVGEPRGETRAVEGLLRSMKRERFESSARMNEEGWAVARTLGVKPWMGAEARKERLLSVESPKVLHIATHGFWVEFGPWEGERGLRGGGKGLDVQLAVLRNPLLRSGLALAGANEFLDEGVEGGGSGEGLMLAAEVEEMDLGATEMVVLSLCEGGSGASESGEGLYGMRRAFILSGARSVVANLWKAEDRATMFLMQRFYENLVERKYSRRQALREAQWLVRSLTEDDLKEWERSGRLPEEPIEEVGETEEERKRPFGDPAYWAGFIVQGEQGSL